MSKRPRKIPASKKAKEQFTKEILRGKPTREEQEHLNALYDKADNLRKEYAKVAAQHRENKVAVGILKGEKERATKDYVACYLSMGLNRQSAWQVNRVSRGLCRLCGKPALPDRNHCEVHEEKIKNSFKGKPKLVEP